MVVVDAALMQEKHATLSQFQLSDEKKTESECPYIYTTFSLTQGFFNGFCQIFGNYCSDLAVRVANVEE